MRPMAHLPPGTDASSAGAPAPPPGDLAAKVDRLPTSPGVYVWKDAAGRALYVGKAGDLRARVRSYLAGRDTRPLVRLLLRRAVDVDAVPTRTASEALLLEDATIKREQPPYNLRLKDDKAFLVVRVDRTHPFPRLRLVRRIRRDGAAYFGPFTDAKALRRTLTFLRSLYPLRSCSDRELAERERPCLYHQIGRCAAPCVGKIDGAAYAALLEGTLAVLRGRDDGLAVRLRADMEAAADALEFERAATLRDRLAALEASVARQHVVSTDGGDRDVVALAAGDGLAVVAVLFVRDGHLVAVRTYPQRTDLSRRDVLTGFLAQYYAGPGAARRILPPEILVEEETDDPEGVAEAVAAQRGGPAAVRVPQRGAGRDLVALAQAKAVLAHQEHRVGATAAAAALAAIGDALGLPGPPRRIEGYDLSHTAGHEPVGAMSVLTDGVPDPDAYRHFAVREAPGGDDYAGLAEVLRRRFEAGEALGPFPDLVLIDGGAGQVAAARDGLRRAWPADAARPPPAVVGLAKARRRDGASTPERLVFPADDVVATGVPAGDAAGDVAGDVADDAGRAGPRVSTRAIGPEDPALRLLLRVRDEAHRFAGRYQRRRRSAALTGTALDGIPGLGPKRRQALLTRFGSVEGVRTAAFEDLAAMPGIGERVARLVKERLEA